MERHRAKMISMAIAILPGVLAKKFEVGKYWFIVLK